MATVHVAGAATGPVLALDEPLSFWGGVREHDGVIVDVHHPQHGRCIAGSVLVMPGARGSSSSSSVMAELVRGGHAPAAILMGTADPILVVGALVAQELYQVLVPIVVLTHDEYETAVHSARITVEPNGQLLFE